MLKVLLSYCLTRQYNAASLQTYLFLLFGKMYHLTSFLALNTTSVTQKFPNKKHCIRLTQLTIRRSVFLAQCTQALIKEGYTMFPTAGTVLMG